MIFLFCHIGSHHAGALLCECQRRRAANAVRGSGHKGNFPDEICTRTHVILAERIRAISSAPCRYDKRPLVFARLVNSLGRQAHDSRIGTAHAVRHEESYSRGGMLALEGPLRFFNDSLKRRVLYDRLHDWLPLVCWRLSGGQPPSFLVCLT